MCCAGIARLPSRAFFEVGFRCIEVVVAVIALSIVLCSATVPDNVFFLLVVVSSQRLLVGAEA